MISSWFGYVSRPKRSAVSRMTLWYCSTSSKDQSLGPGSGSGGRSFSGSGSLNGFFRMALIELP